MVLLGWLFSTSRIFFFSINTPISFVDRVENWWMMQKKNEHSLQKIKSSEKNYFIFHEKLIRIYYYMVCENCIVIDQWCIVVGHTYEPSIYSTCSLFNKMLNEKGQAPGVTRPKIPSSQPICLNPITPTEVEHINFNHNIRWKLGTWIVIFFFSLAFYHNFHLHHVSQSLPMLYFTYPFAKNKKKTLNILFCRLEYLLSKCTLLILNLIENLEFLRNLHNFEEFIKTFHTFSGNKKLRKKFTLLEFLLFIWYTLIHLYSWKIASFNILNILVHLWNQKTAHSQTWSNKPM